MSLFKRLVFASLLIILFTFAIIAPVHAATRPYRGSVPWSVLLCKFSGSPDSTKTPDFYRDMFIRSGTGGLNDYWQATSYGGVNLEGSVVKGWYTIPSTAAQGKIESTRDRNKSFRECVEAARTSRTNPYTVPAGQRIADTFNPVIHGVPWLQNIAS
jgi:hypothetical protein